MLAGHKVEPFSDEYWRLIRQFADFMVQYHQNMILVSPLDLSANHLQGRQVVVRLLAVR